MDALRQTQYALTGRIQRYPDQRPISITGYIVDVYEASLIAALDFERSAEVPRYSRNRFQYNYHSRHKLRFFYTLGE